jgi:hypothetical protein
MPGTFQLHMWFGLAQVQVTQPTRLSVTLVVEQGEVTTLQVALSSPVVLLNPVGSLVPRWIPASHLLNRGILALDGLQMDRKGRLRPHGSLRLLVSLPLQRFVPRELCPRLNRHVSTLLHGQLFQGAAPGSLETLRVHRDSLASILRLVQDYDADVTFTDPRPEAAMPIGRLDAHVDGTLQATGPTQDLFVTAPRAASVAVQLSTTTVHVGLQQPRLQGTPHGEARLRGSVQLTRGAPHPPTPPRTLDLRLRDHARTLQLGGEEAALLDDLRRLAAQIIA